jgi:hypothetical protein
MIIQLEIPKEFAKDYANNRFDDFFRESMRILITKECAAITKAKQLR